MGFATSNLRRRWPKGIIHFEIADDILADARARTAVDAAIDEWNTRTQMQLIARTEDEPNYVVFRLHPSACSSAVGMQGGRQFVSCDLDSSGFSADSVMHEIGHAAGLYHEQMRPDRNDFVNVTDDAVEDAPQNYERRTSDSVLTPYDCPSIMHYPQIADRISPKSGGCTSGNMGSSTVLTNRDIDAINSLLPMDASSGARFLAGDNGEIYFVKSNGQVWRYRGTSENWERLDNGPAEMIAADGNRLYMLKQSGQVWQYNGNPFDWTRLDNGPADSLYSSLGHLYMVKRNGEVWELSLIHI